MYVTNRHMQAAVELARYRRQKDGVYALSQAACLLAGEPIDHSEQALNVFLAAINSVQELPSESPEQNLERLRLLLHARGFLIEPRESRELAPV